MAVPKYARVSGIESLGNARVLTFDLPAPLGFIGGQYIIINAKVTKRAYSIISSDTDQFRFSIAVKLIEGGPGSTFLHAIEIGDEIEFSGPWGKFLPPASGEPIEIIATDTGITAALGLVRGRDFSSAYTLTWMIESEDYFLPPAAAPEALVEVIPPIGDPTRRDIVIPETGKLLYLAGDGDIIFPMKDRAIIECFFNNPARKAPSAARM